MSKIMIETLAVENKTLVESEYQTTFKVNEKDIVLADTNEVDFAGYVKIINNYGVVRTKTLDIVFLTYAIISKYNLQTGDYIYGFCKQSTDKKNISTSVLKVNNIFVNNLKIS